MFKTHGALRYVVSLILIEEDDRLELDGHAKVFIEIDTKEYYDGVDEFISFAFDGRSNNHMIKCPCLHCACTRRLDKKTVREHLYFNGIIKDKQFWKFHGEPSNVQVEEEITNTGLHEMLRDAFGMAKDADGQDSGIDVRKGVKEDKGFTLINPSHLLRTNEPFVLASQVEQVWYVEDPKNSGWFVVRKTRPRDLFDVQDGQTVDKEAILDIAPTHGNAKEHDVVDDEANMQWERNDVDWLERKYDISDERKKWVFQDLNNKWRSWKYVNRKLYFKYNGKAKQQTQPNVPRLDVDQWKEAVQQWTTLEWKRSSETNRKNKGKQKWFHCARARSVADIHEEERVKGHLDLDHSDLFIKRHTRKDGKPTNEAAKHVIEKLKSLKSAQPLSDDSTPHQVAARNDTYTQVLCPDRPGRVSGVGTGPTPTSMWGNESKEALRSENRLLMQRMEELETSMAEKFAKMESMIRRLFLFQFCIFQLFLFKAKNDGKCAPSAHVDVHMTSAVEGQAVDQDVKCIIDCGDISKLIGKRVRLVDIEMQHVADGILISTEIEKVVMGRKIGTEYCECCPVGAHISIHDTGVTFSEELTKSWITSGCSSTSTAFP
ncbi:hypothetical protein Taro_010061 [Colocasia esculenta]|uniref:Transposase-associated domain-containing protein n=1 Tax=Colocasia esculenta TaxID=4460 RepID=A0A843TXY2_COLES|nr:hypothetical protein [Colocasia esculenta]